MANEEERYLTAVAAWSAAHEADGLSITVLHFMNMNGHGVAWIRVTQLDYPDRPDGNKSMNYCLACDHHFAEEGFNPRNYPFPACPLHTAACLQRQIELHVELSQVPEVANAVTYYSSPLQSRALILIAALQRLSNREFVGVTGSAFSGDDVQRLCYGSAAGSLSLDELLAAINPELYKIEGKSVAPRSSSITKVARIGAPATSEGDK